MNAIHWFEIPSHDFTRATRFYETIFATSLHVDDSFEGIRMAVFAHGDQGVGGAVVDMPQAKPHADGVRIYLNGGADLASVLNRVATAGGAVLMPKTKLSDEIGHIALFSDTEGNVIGLHSLH
ncbi:VOC family protein [Uliginosibacterium sediminicola]|uniref:VOC family protein n=1 Tax=Uliginosibacterium sediminicola TaxID=2024550 RepID=A0ABU9YX60_9RHOO